MLYHFTTASLWRQIRREGLTKGVVPVEFDGERAVIIRGYQWLTENPSFSPDWNTTTLISYRRDDVRIAIEIPEAVRQRLVKWDDVGHRMTRMLEDLNDGRAHHEWWLFHGKVHPGWFRDITWRPDLELAS